MQSSSPSKVMEYSAIHDVWSYVDDLPSEYEEYYSERLVDSLYERAPAESTFFLNANCEDPTYMNIRQDRAPPVFYHFGDRYKGLFMFLRETNTKKAAISSLQNEIESLLSIKSDCYLATENERMFAADINIFATMVDNQLRRIRRSSVQQFNAISKKLTELEVKGRSRTHATPSFAFLRKFFQRLFTRRTNA